MSEKTASRTALGVAYMRAAHQVLEAAPRVLEDSIAVKILGAETEQSIRSRVDYFQSPGQRLLRSNVVLRSRYTEDRLAAAVQRGVTQYVILGAGFDTFALRQPAWARALRIVEVDHEGTQKLKREMIAAAALTVPENAHFVNIDFEHESLLDGLKRNSIALNEPTFFAWLGVTMYLHESAIDTTLKSVATFPLGSEIVLTYAPPRTVYQSPFEVRAAELGEPWLSFFTSEQIGKKLLGAGFSRVEFLSSADAYERYFRARPQDLEVTRSPSVAGAMRNA
jgi:methyltransferase (TIGR00027 family)